MTGTYSPDLIRDIVATAHALADAARPETLRHFRQGIGVDDKTGDGVGFDPVTEADRAAERAMRAILAQRRPADAILGEEYGAKSGTSGLTWVLDPIDGTRAYIAGTPTWGVLISVRDEHGPIFGVIDQPYIGERFEGGFGIARLDGPLGESRLATCASRALPEAIVMTTFPEIGSPAEQAGFEAVSRKARLTRYGMDCYAYALVALGQVDLVIEAGLNSYDICAPIAVIEAAGGVVTNWQGGPAHEGGRVIAAANAGIHAEALELLRQTG
ncbi:histidinol phosphatase-like enzyme (inositol monophosphatase family) [Limimaricola soesokkakensis]|uniref:Histidinol-phosphatase n=1 Tax=Limimaricola soesokkakensis TaxID=1343159 RepID=A0A1X6YF82_9RHOB|nr:histidinol-phosphatase [Limimaricola soesokkakensis]PSK87014.1 histidinol phosphatase-like enzyme (inositol monophosphatase family) [Limimaricola soesokkakensis]SLN17751.1 Histidinol-phosphatase [Limimaricola soesokkakensis]